jgi:4-guanidinobutyraldehyde dehydrogenase / NAD-dependent aldehyde dehydrogenase
MEEKIMNLEQAKELDRGGWQKVKTELRPETRNFINGKFVDAKKGRKFESIDPVDNSVICEVARSDGSDIDAAVASARNTFRSSVWSRMAPRDRMDILYRYAGLINEHTVEFAVLDVLNMGKPVAEMVNSDVPGSALTFQFMAECIDKVCGQVTATPSSEFHYILREPLGVVGCVVPWNYPLMMAATKVAPALAAGNSVVLKPAEQSPLSANLMAELFMEAGGPAGVFNVVHGYGEETGKPLALHMAVDKIAFTGSAEVGKLMMVYAGQSNMKRVATECGGKSPQIVMADCDLAAAVTYAINGIFGNQGEVCSAGSRLLVDKKIHDEFLDQFTKRSKTVFQPGDPFDPKTQMGPLVDKRQQKRVLDYISLGKEEGARLCFGGTVPNGLQRGCYVAPTLFAEVKNYMRIAREEIFGPVAAVIPVNSLAEAVDIANDSMYGLAASIWTNDLNAAHKAARDIEAGVVWVNCFDHGDMTMPWGGYKQSGHDRDKCYESVLLNMQTKSVWIHLAS